MKKFVGLLLVLLLAGILVFAGCSNGEETDNGEETENGRTDEEDEVAGGYDDGTYRGIFADGNEIQVAVQFNLEGDVISGLSYRHLFYSGIDYRELEEGAVLNAVVAQHDQIAEYLEGKSLEAVYDLHSPEDFIEDVDSFTGATVRANKVLSAIKDALNRGVYSPANGVSRDVKNYDNGTYRGVFADGGEFQVNVQFSLEGNVISGLSYRHLYYSGIDYRELEEGNALNAVVAQHDQIAEYLEGKSVEAVYDLHSPEDFIEDVDSFTGATVRANKVLSAIKDALNRGVYSPANGVSIDVINYEDGRYRGIFADGDEIQVAVQFDLENNVISNVSFRQLAYSGMDYLEMEEGEALYSVMKQHEQIIAYLEGKSLEVIYELHSPEDFIEDVDSFTGATVRANKVLSAFSDALNRGVYQ